MEKVTNSSVRLVSSQSLSEVAEENTLEYTTDLEKLQKEIQAAVNFPHMKVSVTHSAVRGLFIRVGSQRVIIPFADMQRIDYKKSVHYAPLYALNVLLGFPTEQVSIGAAQTVLILQNNNVAVQVDEVLGEIEVLMKPLPPHLQRPGIVGIATGDSEGVLLVLDLPELLSAPLLSLLCGSLSGDLCCFFQYLLRALTGSLSW